MSAAAITTIVKDSGEKSVDNDASASDSSAASGKRKRKRTRETDDSKRGDDAADSAGAIAPLATSVPLVRSSGRQKNATKGHVRLLTLLAESFKKPAKLAIFDVLGDTQDAHLVWNQLACETFEFIQWLSDHSMRLSSVLATRIFTTIASGLSRAQKLVPDPDADPLDIYARNELLGKRSKASQILHDTFHGAVLDVESAIGEVFESGSVRRNADDYFESGGDATMNPFFQELGDVAATLSLQLKKRSVPTSAKDTNDTSSDGDAAVDADGAAGAAETMVDDTHDDIGGSATSAAEASGELNDCICCEQTFNVRTSKLGGMCSACKNAVCDAHVTQCLADTSRMLCSHKLDDVDISCYEWHLDDCDACARTSAERREGKRAKNSGA